MGGFRLRALIVPLILAIIITGSVYLYLAGTERTGGKLATASVVVAIKAVPAKTVLSADMLATKSIPPDYLLPNAITKMSDAVGKMTVMPVAVGEMLVQGKLDQKGSGGESMAYQIPTGMRAVTVAVNEVVAVAGFPQPGDSVDVYVTLDRPEETRLALENVPILAVANKTDAKGTVDPKALSSMTLCVSPAQATALIHMSEFGRLHLALRPAGERTTGEATSVTTGTLATVLTAERVAEESREYKFAVQVISVNKDALAAAGLAPVAGVTLTELDMNGYNAIRALLGSGQARTLTSSDLSTISRTSVRFAATKQFTLPLSIGGSTVTSWQEYGLSLTIEPVTYNRPYIDLTLHPEVRIVSYKVGASDRNAPEVAINKADSTVRVDQGNVVAIHGLVSADDFKPPAGVTERYVLPDEYAPEEVRLGTAELVILVIPQN
ncbi:MAG: Flp pilus assembly protein CpaB [Chloroflexota bacterium]